jgi:hypothetical protein
MTHVSVSRRILVPCALAGAVVLAACEDKRVKEVDSGITRDSTMTIIAHDLPPTAKSDSFPNVYIRERYLMAGKNYEVLYFTPNNEKAQAGKDTAWGKLTPIVLMNNLTLGKGWKLWDSISTANKIPLKKR